MTVSLQQLDANTNTFGDWLFRTNEISNTLSTVMVSVDSASPPVGNAVIEGSLASNTVYTQNIFGGEIGNTANLTVSSNAVFSSNVFFNSESLVFNINTSLLVAPNNFTYSGSNSTHYVIGANTATGKARFVSADEILGDELIKFSIALG